MAKLPLPFLLFKKSLLFHHSCYKLLLTCFNLQHINARAKVLACQINAQFGLTGAICCSMIHFFTCRVQQPYINLTCLYFPKGNINYIFENEFV